VRVEHRIDALNSVVQRLGAKIRACVDQNTVLAQFQKNARPQPLVPGVVGDACLAAAANHGNADVGTGAEHENGSVLELVEHLDGLSALASIRRDNAGPLLFGLPLRICCFRIAA
jgi:hypothetical protein